jgi:hypothetical protein
MNSSQEFGLADVPRYGSLCAIPDQVAPGRRQSDTQRDAETIVMRNRLGRVEKGGVKGFGIGFAIAIVCGLLLDVQTRAQSPSTSTPITLDSLLRMSPAELDSVYRQGTATAIPEGRIRGTALLRPGTRRTRALSRGARLLWQGKVFEPGQSTAVNRFFGLPLIRGQVYEGLSWLDGRPSLVLDYSQTSRVYANNRDEIRQVAPGLFLGLMFDRTTAPPGLVMYFALDTRP